MIELEFALPAAEPAGAHMPYYRRRELMEATLAKEPVLSTAPDIVGALADKTGFSGLIDFAGLMDPQNDSFRELVPAHRYPVTRKAVGLLLPFEVDTAAGVAAYTLPDELEQFAEAIQLAATHEHTAYPAAAYETREGVKVSAGEAKLTVDQEVISPGRAQRGDTTGKAHRDGPWGHWLHLYMVSDTFPTEFFTVSDPGVARVSSEIPAQKLGERIVPAVFEVAFANSTSLHRSPVIEERVRRTFIRLTYDHALEA
jgi:hypothetical protein